MKISYNIKQILSDIEGSKRAGLLAVFLFLSMILVYFYFLIPGRWTTVDFDNYYITSWLLVSGRNPYCLDYGEIELPKEFLTITSRGVTNQPFLSLLLAPLGYFSPSSAWVGWTLINMLSIVGIAHECLRLTGLSRSWSRSLFFGNLLLVFFPFFESLWMGQVQPILFYLLLLGVGAFLNKHLRTAGSLFGFVAGLKMLPGLLLVWLVVRKEWLTALYFAAIFSVCTLVGAIPWQGELMRGFFNCGIPALDLISREVSSTVSFYMVPYRIAVFLIQPPNWLLTDGILPLKVLSFGFGLWVVYWFAKAAKRDRAQELLSISAALTCSFFSFGIAWPSYLIVLTLPFCLILASQHVSEGGKRGAVNCLFLLLFMEIFYYRHLGLRYWFLHSLWPVFVVIWTLWALSRVLRQRA